MSLIEVVVALALMATGVMATISAMDGSTRAVAAVDHRSRAVLLAQAEVETLRSVPYEALGLSAAADGFQPTFEGRDTVTVAAQQVKPISDEAGTGVTYRVERDITWENVSLSDGTAVAAAAKRLTVQVSWPGGGQAVRLDSAVSPVRKGVVCSQRWVDPSSVPLTGVVNSYLGATAPSAVGATVLTVGTDYRIGSPTKIEPGDLIMVIQMTGDTAGTYEYAIATSAPSGGVLGVTGTGIGGGLLNAYGTDGSFQVVRVPTYGDATVGPGLVPLPFDGFTGGVLAMDVTGTLGLDAPIDASGTGLSTPSSVRSTTPARLVPGAGTPMEAAGGGLVVIRAGSIDHGSDIRSDGQSGSAGGDGGTVVVELERGGLENTTVEAAGGTPSGLGGALLATAAPISTKVPGASGADADAGTVLTTMDAGALAGVRMGVGCEPAVRVSVTTLTPAVTAGPGQTASYQIVVWAAPGRGGPAAMTVRDVLPAGFTFRSTLRVDTKGDVVRPSVFEPAIGDPAPSWASFWMAPGSVFAITFDVDVSAGAMAGLADDSAIVSYASSTGSWLATYPGASGSSDDVTVTAAAP